MYYKDEWCRLCEKLDDVHEPTNIYTNMTDWFYYDDHGNWLCTDGSERTYYNYVQQEIKSVKPYLVDFSNNA